MTKLDKFYEEASKLPEGLKAELELELTHLLQKYAVPDEDWELSPEQMEDLKRRVNNPNRKIASHADVKAIFGHNFDD